MVCVFFYVFQGLEVFHDFYSYLYVVEGFAGSLGSLSALPVPAVPDQPGWFAGRPDRVGTVNVSVLRNHAYFPDRLVSRSSTGIVPRRDGKESVTFNADQCFAESRILPGSFGFA